MIRWLFGVAAACSSVLFFTELPRAWTFVALVLTGAGVSSLLPLLTTLTWTMYRDMSGTALGIVKLAVPIGGIVAPFIVSVLSRWASFHLALGFFPLLAAAGFIVLTAMGGKILRAGIKARQGGIGAGSRWDEAPRMSKNCHHGYYLWLSVT